MDNLAFLLRRLRTRWPILLLLLMSVTVSAGLLACGPLLVDAVMRFALPHRLQTAEPLDSGLRLTSFDKPDTDAYLGLDAAIRQLTVEKLGDYHPQVFATVSSNWLFPWYLEQMLKDQRLQVRSMQDIQTHAGLSDGSWPEAAQQAAALEQGVFYAVITPGLAQAFGLEVGDRLPLSRQNFERVPSSWLEVSGILEPFDAQEAYWFGGYSPLGVGSSANFLAEYYAIVDQPSLFMLQNILFPLANSELNWNILLDAPSVQVENAPELVEQVASLRTRLDEITPAVSLKTNLEQLLVDFLAQARIVRITLFVVIIEVLFLALYFLSMAASLAAQQVEGEFASLASRGASFGQVFRIQALEAGLIGLTGLLVGPLLAWLAVWSLGLFGPFAALGLEAWMPRLPWTAWLAAAIGALAACIFLLVPVYPAVQRSVVTHLRRTTRAGQAPWWQRAYLDVLAALVSLVLVWRTQSYESLAGGGQVDWLLLLAPLALLVSTAILLLRLFPLLMRGLAWLAARGRGLTTPLAMWYEARNPGQVVHLVLLLALTMSLGILSTGLDETLEKVEGERARYSAGADLRLILGTNFTPLDTSALQDITALSRVWRGSASINLLSSRVTPLVTMVAVEPYSLAEVTRYRYDYADQPFGELLGKLVVDTSKQSRLLLPLAGEPARFGVWVRDQKARTSDARLVDNIHLQAKLQTAQSEGFLVDLLLTPVEGRSADEAVPDEEWRYFEAELPWLPAESFPLSLHSLWLNPSQHAEESFSFFQLYLDDFSVTDRQSGEVSVAENFEDITRIWETNQPQGVVSFTRKIPAHSGSGTLSVWTPSVGAGYLMGIYQAEGFLQDPLPVLASQEFISMTQVEVGDRIEGFANGQPVSMVIAGVVRYFPTLYDSPGRGFLIAPRDALLTILNRQQRMPVNANELWAGTETSQAASQAAGAISTAASSLTLSDELRSLKADPLTLGLRSLTLMGATLAALLSLAGVATFLYMSISRRETTFAILRSLGLSSGGLYGMLVVEQVVMVLAGLLLGGLLGILLNNLVVPGLPLSLGGRPPIPPMLPLTDWSAVLRFSLVLAGAFMLVVGTATFLLWRSRLQRLLRIGQE